MRWFQGKAVFTERDWLFLFGHSREKTLSARPWLRFARLALGRDGNWLRPRSLRFALRVGLVCGRIHSRHRCRFVHRDKMVALNLFCQADKQEPAGLLARNPALPPKPNQSAKDLLREITGVDYSLPVLPERNHDRCRGSAPSMKLSLIGLLIKKTQLLLRLFSSQPAPFALVCLPVPTSGSQAPLPRRHHRKSIAVEIIPRLYAPISLAKHLTLRGSAALQSA